jgi:hypothetical protein
MVSFTPYHFTPRERTPRPRCIVGRVGLGVNLETVGNRSQAIQPVAILNYPDSIVEWWNEEWVTKGTGNTRLRPNLRYSPEGMEDMQGISVSLVRSFAWNLIDFYFFFWRRNIFMERVKVDWRILIIFIIKPVSFIPDHRCGLVVKSSWLLTQRSWVRFPALPNFLHSSSSRTGSTHPHEHKWGDTWNKINGSSLETRY